MSHHDQQRVAWDALSYVALAEDLPQGTRWSTWLSVERGARGPQPYPSWLVTSQAALDTELGILKTGKEADVMLLRRGVPDNASTPDAGASCLLAAKRYRGTDHRLFHRDSGYREGRRVRRSRDQRAMAKQSSYGRAVEASQWALAEWGALCRLYEAGVTVPYPVQIDGTELLMEFISDDDAAAPRLAQTRPPRSELARLYEQLQRELGLLARLGVAHGDLSPFNTLVAPSPDGPRLVLIDVPQVVDIVSHPQGVEYLRRDCLTMAAWFVRRGMDVDAEQLFGETVAQAW